MGVDVNILTSTLDFNWRPIGECQGKVQTIPWCRLKVEVCVKKNLTASPTWKPLQSDSCSCSETQCLWYIFIVWLICTVCMHSEHGTKGTGRFSSDTHQVKFCESKEFENQANYNKHSVSQISVECRQEECVSLVVRDVPPPPKSSFPNKRVPLRTHFTQWATKRKKKTWEHNFSWNNIKCDIVLPFSHRYTCTQVPEKQFCLDEVFFVQTWHGAGRARTGCIGTSLLREACPRLLSLIFGVLGWLQNRVRFGSFICFSRRR